MRRLIPHSCPPGRVRDSRHKAKQPVAHHPGPDPRMKGGTVEQLVDVDETARMLACTPAAIRKWLSQGRLPRVKVGRLTRVRSQDIADVIAHGLPEARSFRR